jgi:hypothetical protein
MPLTSLLKAQEIRRKVDAAVSKLATFAGTQGVTGAGASLATLHGCEMRTLLPLDARGHAHRENVAARVRGVRPGAAKPERDDFPVRGYGSCGLSRNSP